MDLATWVNQRRHHMARSVPYYYGSHLYIMYVHHLQCPSPYVATLIELANGNLIFLSTLTICLI
jgi:trehalose utilization protein